MRPEAKLQFDRACEALGLDEARRDRAWRQMSDLGLSPDDPTVIFLAVSGVLEKAADAFADLPAQIETTAKRVVGPVAKAAAAKAEASFADLGERIASDVSGNIGDAIEHRVSAEISLRRFGLSGVVAVAALVLALLFGAAGYFTGKASTASIAAEWQAWAVRPDARAWLDLASANPDLNATKRAYCAPGGGNVSIVNGATRCGMYLWLDGSAAPAPTGAVAGVRSTVLDWLYGWGPIWLLAAGLLAGLLIRRAVLSVSTLPGVRWLLAA